VGACLCLEIKEKEARHDLTAEEEQGILRTALNVKNAMSTPSIFVPITRAAPSTLVVLVFGFPLGARADLHPGGLLQGLEATAEATPRTIPVASGWQPLPDQASATMALHGRLEREVQQSNGHYLARPQAKHHL
jgi:hypothetical protein